MKNCPNLPLCQFIRRWGGLFEVPGNATDLKAVFLVAIAGDVDRLGIVIVVSIASAPSEPLGCPATRNPSTNAFCSGLEVKM